MGKREVPRKEITPRSKAEDASKPARVLPHGKVDEGIIISKKEVIPTPRSASSAPTPRPVSQPKIKDTDKKPPYVTHFVPFDYP